MERHFQEVYRNATSQNPSKVFHIRGNLELIVAWLVDQVAGDVQRTERPMVEYSFERTLQKEEDLEAYRQDPRINVLVDYIVTHPTEHYTSEVLCQMVNVSPSTLRRLFIAIFKIKAYSRMNGTNLHSPVELQPEMHAESHLEEHPMSLL